MAHELDAPAPVVASSGPSRRAITIAAVIFAVLAATALTWAKCWPYASKTAHVLTNAFGGISILTEGGRTPAATPSWHSAWTFTVTYFRSVWIALVAALVIAVAAEALIPRRGLVRQRPAGSADRALEACSRCHQ